MSDNQAKQLTINEVINQNYIFEIPNYQRGYRWGETEVTDLLDDINEYNINTINITELEKSLQTVRDNCNNHSYCLQPIAFDTKNKNSGKMIVVDGQQRLTTLFLILKFIETKLKSFPADVLGMVGISDIQEYCRCYLLQYYDINRNKVFNEIKNNLDEIRKDNIDAYYITKAYQVIKKWSDKKIGDKILLLISFAINVFYGTSIIWYEIDNTTDGNSNDYFAKTNTGKIPLTNSELIKANLMLDEYCIQQLDESKISGTTEEEKNKQIAIQKDLFQDRLKNERIKISRQWDEIESSLRTDDFWYFLAEDSDKYENTRIDFIFDIIAEKLYPNVQNFLGNGTYEEFVKLNKERSSFIIIARYLKENADSKPEPIGLKVWQMVWETYMVFREWFDNREWYHYIGYLISIGEGYDAKQLINLFSDKTKFSKNIVKDDIKSKIKQSVNLCILENGNEKDLSLEEYNQYLERLIYRENNNNDEIKKVLLLFNVTSILTDSVHGKISSRDTYFPFARYKKEKWNLEHIHSKADGEFSDKNSAKEYIMYLEEMLERLKKENDDNSEKKWFEEAINIYEQKKQEQLELHVNEDDATKFAIQEAAQLVTNRFDSDLDDNKLNGIGNMALLDEKTNKSYKNAPFFMKRMIIGDIVRGKKNGVSRFIPFCTRNTFDKTYTRHPNNMLHWTNDDCDEYKNAIAETIWNYFSRRGD